MKRKYEKGMSMLLVDTSEMELHEHMAIKSFTSGDATEEQYDKLLRMMNMLLIAGQTCKTRNYALDYAEAVIKPVLISIKSRFIAKKKFGATSQELDALKEMLRFSREFWIRQTTKLWNFCADQVDAFYRELTKGKLA